MTNAIGAYLEPRHGKRVLQLIITDLRATAGHTLIVDLEHVGALSTQPHQVRKQMRVISHIQATGIAGPSEGGRR